MYKDLNSKRLHYLKSAQYKRLVLSRWKRIKGCVDCGYNLNPDALELDHRPGEKKWQTVASCMYYSWKRIKEELSKCDVRCANCHAIKTAERRKVA